MAAGDQGRALLDLLAPQGSEELIGAVFTTFKLDGRFLEEQVLPTLFGLRVAAGESRTIASELHERLLGAPVHVWCDERGFAGDRRLGTYDIGLVASARTFHPKLALTLWERAGETQFMRVLVTSGNLTEAGYRQNAEVAVAGTSEESRDAALISGVVEVLEEVARVKPPEERTSQLLADAHGLTVPNGGAAARRLLTTTRPIMEQFFELLEERETIQRAEVISPFFERGDGTASTGCTTRFIEEVLARASPDFEGFRFFVPWSVTPSGRLGTALPVEVLRDFSDRAATSVNIVDDAWPVTGIGQLIPRRLHAKLVLLETNLRCLVLAGSANFTNAAMLEALPNANWEASVALFLPRTASDGLRPPSFSAALDEIEYQPLKDEPPEPALLIEDAVYTVGNGQLWVRFMDRAAPEEWTLQVDARPIDSGDSGALPDSRVYELTHVLSPVLVQRTAAGERFFPIQIDDKDLLSPIPDMPPPDAQTVLSFFARQRSRGEYDAGATSHGGPDGADVRPPFDHLALFCRALGGVKESLEEPARSRLEYRARWRGAWGVSRLIQDLETRLRKALDYPAYVLFEALELHAVVEAVALSGDAAISDSEVEALRNEATSHLGQVAKMAASMLGGGDVADMLASHYRVRL